MFFNEARDKMNHLKKVLNKKVGASPGEVSYIGEAVPEKTVIKLFCYDKDSFVSIVIDSLETLRNNLDKDRVNWIHITGLSDQSLITEIALSFGVHKLSLEDAFNTGHIPKYEEIENYLMFISKGFLGDSGDDVLTNQISVFLFKNVVLTIQDKSLELLDIKIQRIEQAKGKTRSKKADYLFFAILDAYTDTFYSSFDRVREELLELEDKLLDNRTTNYLNEILRINKKLASLRKIIFPVKSAMQNFLFSEMDLFADSNMKYLNDLKDHIDELVEYHNTFNEFTKSLFQLNENNLNADTNKVIKILTIITAIFIPLTFIAGIYGMNFKYMPELKWHYGYFMILTIMFVTGVSLFVLMKIKKWF